MADSTTPRTPDYRIDRDINVDLLTTAAVATKGRYAAFNMSTGLVENANDSALLMPCGYWDYNSIGNNDNRTGDGTIKWATKSGEEIKNETVAGASSAADKGKLVYPSDNQTLTLTRPSVGLPMGVVKEWVASTTCHILLFTFMEALMYGFLGTNKKSIRIMDINSQDLEGGASDLLTSFPLYGHGKIVRVYAILESDDAGTVAGAKNINLEIGTTDLTGGVVALAAADTRGALIAGSAVTANNEFSNGDLLSVEQSAGTGYTPDMQTRYSLWMDVEYLPGA